MRARDPAYGYTVEEISIQFDSVKSRPTTLNGAGYYQDDQRLAFIILFMGQHPEWPPKVLCKSNLRFLSSATAATIPIFTELSPTLKPSVPNSYTLNPRFIFSGYRPIISVAYLEPQSQELIKMLDTKFTSLGKERTADNDKKSRGVRWAVVEMGAVGGRETNPMVPLKGLPETGVREIWDGMRLADHGG